MRKALVKLHNENAGILIEENNKRYVFQYYTYYQGSPISLTMPVLQTRFEYTEFPPFFEGLLPEGTQLEGLLKAYKIDKYDYFKQLQVTGADLVGAVTVIPLEDTDE